MHDRGHRVASGRQGQPEVTLPVTGEVADDFGARSGRTGDHDPGATALTTLFFVDDPWMPNIKPASSAVPIDKDYGYQRDPDIFPVSYDVFSWPPPVGVAK